MMAAEALPRGSTEADFRHHIRNSILNQEPCGGSPAAGGPSGGPAACDPESAGGSAGDSPPGGPAAGDPAPGDPPAGAPGVSPSIIDYAPGGPAAEHASDGYFASTIFLRLSKPALNTPSIVSVAVLSFSLSGGVSLKFLRLNLADHVTNVLSAPSDVTTKVAE
jgi:hypothetical protein